MSLEALESLLLLLKKHGVTHYKAAECELQISPIAIALGDAPAHSMDYSPKKLPEHQTMIPTTPQMTDEQMLYWSSGYDPADEKAQSPEQNSIKN